MHPRNAHTHTRAPRKRSPHILQNNNRRQKYKFRAPTCLKIPPEKTIFFPSPIRTPGAHSGPWERKIGLHALLGPIRSRRAVTLPAGIYARCPAAWQVARWWTTLSLSLTQIHTHTHTFFPAHHGATGKKKGRANFRKKKFIFRRAPENRARSQRRERDSLIRAHAHALQRDLCPGAACVIER